MPITLNYSPIAARVTDHTLILTPNTRTQKAISAGLVSSLDEGDVVYAPSINTFSQWQAELWQSISFFKPLPTTIGNLEIKTWLKEQIASDDNWRLTNELGVAEKVLDGYRVLSQWHLSLPDLVSLDTLETQYFVKWVTALEAFLTEADLIPQFTLCNHLLKFFEQTDPSLKNLLPKHLLLVSFNQLTPTEKTLLERCQTLGTKVEYYYPKRQPQMQTRVEFDDFKGEVNFAGKFTAQKASAFPDKTIGVVVHQLANHLDTVHQIFSECFQPEEKWPWQSLEKIKYNVSAGQNLTEHPIVSVAIQILQLQSQGFDLATLRLLKNSPFIDWGKNAHEIRRFLHAQTLLGYQNYSIQRLLSAIEEDENNSGLELLKKRIGSLQQRPSSVRPISVWVDFWRAELNAWGWLENYSLDPCEAKLLSEFQLALNACFNLARVYPHSSQSQAKEYILQVLRQTPFQLPSDRTNVHVLGVLEATGLEFDELILVGFDRNNWPAKAKLNPFLPVAFQQQHKMPGSSAEREFDYTRDLSDALLNGADQVWVTQSRLDDGSNGASPLFSHLHLADVAKHLSDNQLAPLSPDFRWLTDEKIDLPLGDIRGGAYLLSYFAACPFKAMSHFQFNIRPVQQTQSGIEARVKGAWLHRALELFWIAVQDQRSLKKLTQLEMENLVWQMLTEAQAEYQGQLLASAAAEIVGLEKEKLQQQILQWLQLELERADFSVATEVEKELSLGPLNFRFRIDRMDTDANGMLEIIDYKSGQTDVKKWLGLRPDEAQMPAYVLACSGHTVASLSYAKIKTGEVSRSGLWFSQDTSIQYLQFDEQGVKDKTRYLQSDPTLIKTNQPLPEQWQENLQRLAIEIAEGVMPVSPKNQPETCRYCDFSSFCRINEIQADEQNTALIHQDGELE